MQERKIGQHRIRIFDNAVQLNAAAGEHLIGACAQQAKLSASVNVALCGGTTPVGLYQQLVNSGYAQNLLDAAGERIEFPWHNVRFFFSDERYVPLTDKQSNYRMAREAFLNKAPIDDDRVFPIPTDCENADLCAQRYANQLVMLPADDGVPIFDYLLLGMGEDGHTASLFPDTPILDNIATSVAAVFVKKLNSWRISLTYPVLNHARNCSVLVSGKNKARALAEVMNNNNEDYPIARINNASGVNWFIDKEAASQLN